MSHHTVDFIWRNPKAVEGFSTGVCLHGHTMHSQECLSFLPRYLRQVPAISQLVSRYDRGPRAVDFARAFWTPPLNPVAALGLEQKQILAMGLRPLVSLTDHDDMVAGISLQLTAAGEIPLSVEWTVPYARSIFHLGVHNLPPASARAWMSSMAAYTSQPVESLLPEILSELARIPGVLIVLNHPFWLEEGVEEAEHRPALDRILGECAAWLHAFELNGTRPWKENENAMELARAWSRPLISGGDRHGCEPSACLNLTNATTFSEFVSEIHAGRSSIVFLPQYREPIALRVLEAAWDILRPYPEYAGREQWTDRFFYRAADGTPCPLSRLWQDRVPWMLSAATVMLQVFAAARLRPALRLLLAERGEVLP